MRNIQAIELAHEIVNQQKEWLHKAVQRLVPEKYREMVAMGDVPREEMQRFLIRNGIQWVPHRKTPIMELHVKGVMVDRFEPVLRVPDPSRGGALREVDFYKLQNPSFEDDDIWKEGS